MSSDWTPGLPDKAVGHIWLSVDGGARGRYVTLAWVGMAWQGRHEGTNPSAKPELELTLRVPDEALDVPLATTKGLGRFEAWQPFVRPKPWRPT